MTMSYISPGMSATLRREVGRLFWHTYTRTPIIPTPDNPATPLVNESRNAWGEQVFTDGPPVTNQSCLFVEAGTTVITPNGLIEVNRPVLLVPLTDPLTEGDKVSAVATKPATGIAAVVLFAGPVIVESVTNIASEIGGALYKQVAFRGVTTV